jgi:glycosyltransferase involved in cell wall biosynthesis
MAGLSLAQGKQVHGQEIYAKMKICICTQLWLGMLCHGGVHRIVDFARNVSEHGVDVYLIDRSVKKSLSAQVFSDEKYYAIENGEFHERYYPFHIRFLLPGIVKFFQEALNCWFSLLTRTTWSEVSYSYLLDPYLLVKLLFICKKEKIDLVQCEFPFPTFSSLVLKKVTGTPVIYDAHNIESERIGSMPNVNKLHVGLMKKLEIMSCCISDWVFAVSETDKERLVSWGIPKKKITVIPNSVETGCSPLKDGRTIRKKYGLENAFVLIFHGYLSYNPNRQAVQILLDILPTILKKHDSVHLLLVGKDPPKISQPNVIVTGFVESISEYIAAADLAVVPLLSGGGTKLKMLEYMACGKAIVSTIKAAEGLNLKNGRDILMTKYPDSQFVDLILKLIEDDDIRKKIGTNAREKIKLFYDWEKNAEKAVSIYDNLIHNKKAYRTN